MDNQELLSKGIGSIEIKPLDAKPITVAGVVAESLLGKEGTKKAGKEVGKKLVILGIHPDKEEPIKISQMRFVKGETVKTSTMWINLDEDGLIQKGSTVSLLLEKAEAENMLSLEGKVLDTEKDAGGYLCIKLH